MSHQKFTPSKIFTLAVFVGILLWVGSRSGNPGYRNMPGVIEDQSYRIVAPKPVPDDFGPNLQEGPAEAAPEEAAPEENWN